MKILIADDDPDLRDILDIALRRAGYDVVAAADGHEALDRFRAEDPDLVLLDVAMPGLDGLEACRRLRAGSAVPIIMLTVRNREEEILRAFELGADDYITKPFSPRQLVARIQAALRRSAPAAASAPPTSPGAETLRLDPERHLARTPDGATIRLTPLEYRLLHVLVQNAGRPMPAQELVEQVWECRGHVGDRAILKGLVRRLRRKLEAGPARPAWIRTEGGGYAFRA